MHRVLSDMLNIQELSLDLPHRVRHARPEDAPVIFALKVEAFGRTFLPYTIYQAPQAVRYLRKLILQSMGLGNQRFVLVEDAARALGYYHALYRDAEFFLNYIAVAETVRGQAWGSFLLRHFEEAGRLLGCRQLVLDVFESNHAALNWYQRLGYHSASASFQARLAIGSIPDKDIPLDCDEESWVRARREEDYWGFSKVECSCGPGRITVGLIAQTVCKLLNYEPVPIEEAMLAVAHGFREQREILILSSLSEVPSNWHLLSKEKVMHLVKAIS